MCRKTENVGRNLLFTPPLPFNKKHSWSHRVPHHLGILGLGSKINNNQCRFRTLWHLSWVFLLLYSLFLYDCVFLVWCEGMSCYRSTFPSWKRQREASTSSRAATGPSGCSVCLTTACFLRSGLQLQRLSSSPVISVSGIFRCDWNLYCCLSWLILSPFLFLFWKLNPKIVIELWVVFPSYNCVDRFKDAVALCACHISVWWHGWRKNLCEAAGGPRICAVPSKAPLSRHVRTTSYVVYVVVSHHFELLWDMETLKILITLDLSLFTGEWSLDWGRVNILVVGYFIIARNRRPFTEISIPPRHNFESNFSLISCSMFIFSCCGL